MVVGYSACEPTLRGRRGRRSSLYAYLRKPIYITHPNVLVPLLENAWFHRLPTYYQARTLEEAGTGRESPFVWNHIRAEVRRERQREACKCEAHCSPTEQRSPPFKKRRGGKRITFIVRPEDVLLCGARKANTMSQPATSGSLDRPVTQIERVRQQNREARNELSTLSGIELRGPQIVAGAGLFRSTTHRIRVFQRGGSFVWVIKSIRVAE